MSTSIHNIRSQRVGFHFRFLFGKIADGILIDPFIASGIKNMCTDVRNRSGVRHQTFRQFNKLLRISAPTADSSFTELRASGVVLNSLSICVPSP